MLRFRIRSGLLAWLVYVALVLIFTWPLFLHLHTHVLGPWKGDNFEYVWKLWWFPHAIFDLHISPFFQPNIYYPHGYPLSYGEITPIHTVLMMPLTLLIGEVAAYNSMMLFSTALSAWIVYLLTTRWLRAFVKDDQLLFVCSILAGGSFAFSSYQMIRIAGHLPLIDTQWLVLAIFSLDCWLSTKRLHYAILLGFAFAFAALSTWYYAFMLMLILPIYALVRAENLRAILTQRKTWLAVSVAVIIAGVLCVPFLMPYLQLAHEGLAKVPLESASFWADSPLDYLVPNPRNPLWKNVSQWILWPFGTESPAEFMTASIGWITLLFGILGWTHVRGKSWRALRWIIVVSFIVSLGPFLHMGRLPTSIPLPTLLLIKLLPAADGIRSWGRFSVLVTLGMSLFAAAGLATWLQEHKWWKQARTQVRAASICCMVMLFTLWSGPIPLIPVEARPVDQWMAQQPGQFAIMQYPLATALSGPSMLYTRYHGKQIVFGYGTYLPLYYTQLYPALLTFPNDSALDQLKNWSVKYVLVSRDELSGEPYTLKDIDNQPRLHQVITVGDQVVYALLY